jgi:hypothetical protein
MNEQEIMNSTPEMEKEIAHILIDSSLYLGMSPAERKKLLRYLVSSYFDFFPAKNSRALPSAMQTGPMM